MPEVPGILSAADVLATAHSIAEVQRPDGMIPWFPGGHCDPWNHVEAAMALTVCGLHARGRARLRVAGRQPAGRRQLVQLLPGRGGEGPPARHQRVRLRGGRRSGTTTWSPATHDLLRRLWPVIERAIDFVLRWQRPDGSVRWSLDPAGPAGGLRPADRVVVDLPQPALRGGGGRATGQGPARLGAGRRSAGPRGGPPPGRLRPQGRVRHGLVLPDAVGRPRGRAGRSSGWSSGWATFVMEGLGVRCVSTGDWVTAAETAECVHGPRRARARRGGPRPLRRRPGPAAARRLVLDRAWSTPRR